MNKIFLIHAKEWLVIARKEREYGMRAARMHNTWSVVTAQANYSLAINAAKKDIEIARLLRC